MSPLHVDVREAIAPPRHVSSSLRLAVAEACCGVCWPPRGCGVDMREASTLREAIAWDIRGVKRA